MSNDINSAGCGIFGGGKYDNVRMSGSGQIDGDIECASFSSSGSMRCNGNLRCLGIVKGAGSSTVTKDIICDDTVSFAGSVTVGGSIKCRELSSAGNIIVKGDGIEAETAKIAGGATISGLLNAESVTIHHQGGVTIDSIGGSEITILSKSENHGFFTKSKKSDKKLVVKESIEGDTITLEGVKAKSVVGRIVKVDENCEIGTIRYTESAEIADGAKVGSAEMSS
ncbi:MAG: hypothetical protein LUD43_03535 [Firmicutes bacterium]|nr:hypothetical protein [Bacillota bacterium]